MQSDTELGGNGRGHNQQSLRLVVLGATGGTGLELVKQALGRGHLVTAFVRSPERLKEFRDDIKIRQGDLLNSASLQDFIQGHDAVLSGFGPRAPRAEANSNLLERFARALTAAMPPAGVRRVVVESVAFLFKNSIFPPAYLLGRLFLPRTVADASAMERIFANTALDWTMVRPPELTDKPYTGKYRVQEGHLPRFGLRLDDQACGEWDVDSQGCRNRELIETETQMTLYSIILFLHVAAVLGLFASLSFEVLSLFHLRRASDLSDVQRWIDPVPGIPLLAIGSIFVVLLSGIYLAVRMSAFEMAWPKVAILALLLIAPFGALTGKRMRAIRRISAEALKMMKPELLRRLQDPFLKVSLGIRIAVFFGIVLLMAAKPELWQSITIVVGSVVLGLLLSLVAWRRTGPLPARGELQR